MSSAPAVIELDAITQDFPQPDGSIVRVVDPLTLRLEGPSIVMLLGPSGCGKSTVMRMMGGVRPFGVASPTSGGVRIDGVPCTGHHDDAVMVFQRYANRPDLTVRQNVSLPFTLALWKARVPPEERTRRVDEMLEAVGLADKADLRPAQLSGGQNQRVALARALALRPRILLMDEPFGALDAQTRDGMQTLLVKLIADNPCLVVFVTHDVSEAIRLGDRVIVLSTGPARVADDFTVPRGPARPRSPDALALEQRILNKLHGTGGQVRVSL
jgi:ABC-type nitrate/sulfonate/bicarbonate transport system ATPase subunit